MSVDGAPAVWDPNRSVWTGDRLLAWGRTAWECPSTDATGFCGRGAAYDPTHDRWTPIASNGAPSHRFLHVAAWTGTRFVVWGGEGCGSLTGACQDGGMYDPQTDSWEPIEAGAPIAPRGNASSVWTGTRLLVFGGEKLPPVSGAPVETFGDGAAFDPATKMWSAIEAAGAPSPRRYHSAVWTGAEMIVWGGGSTEEGFLADGARYDPANGRWSPVSRDGAPSARWTHSAMWTGTEMLVWGGACASGAGDNQVPCPDGAAYDPARNRWRPISPEGAPSAMFGARAVWANGKMIVWGGAESSSGGVYEPVEDRWVPMLVEGAPAPRTDHLAVWTGTEMIVWAGILPGGSEPETFDGARFRLSP